MKYFIFVSVIFRFTGSVFGSPFEECEKESLKWFECVKNSDCTVISSPCGHPTAAANNKYYKNAERCNNQKGSVLDCVAWDEKRDGKTRAICLKNVCATEKLSSDSK